MAILRPRGNILSTIFPSNGTGLKPSAILGPIHKPLEVVIQESSYFADLAAAKRFLSDDGHFRRFVSAQPALIATGVTYSTDLKPKGASDYYIYSGSTTSFEPDMLHLLPSLGEQPSTGFLGGYSTDAIYLDDKQIKVTARGNRLVWQHRLADSQDYEDIIQG